MADIKAKWVRIYSPGGVTVNFQGQTGLTRPLVVSVDLLKKFIERGATVEEIKADETTVLLTLDNYNKDNGGIAVKDEEYAPDLEAQHDDDLKAIHDAYVKDCTDEIVAKMEDIKKNAIKLVSVAKTNDLTFMIGTKFNTILLPYKVEATYSNNKKEMVPVLWDISKVDSTKEAAYAIKGDPVLPQGVGNPDEVKVTCNVTFATMTLGKPNTDKAVETASTPKSTPASNSGK